MKRMLAIMMVMSLLCAAAAALAEEGPLPWDTPIIVDDGYGENLTLMLACVEDDAMAEGVEEATGRWVRVELSATGRTIDMGEIQELCDFSMMSLQTPQHLTLTARQDGDEIEYLISLWFDKPKNIDIDSMTVDIFNWGKAWSTVELSLAGAPGPEQ